MTINASCFFASVHRVSGLTLPATTPQLALVDRPHLRALVGTNLDDLCYDLDVSRSVATLLLRGLFNAERADFEAGLAAEMRQIADHRQTEGKGRLLLFVESATSLDLDLTNTHHEANDMVVGFDLVDRGSIAQQHRSAARNIIAALSLTVGRDIDTHKLSEGFYCRDDSGKRYLSYTFKAHGAGLVVSSAPEALAAVAEYVARCEERSDLGRVVRLTADASTTADRFRLWLSAWTALESLINTRFKRYERTFLNRLRTMHVDTPTTHYLARAAEVMPERYRLLDKFAVVAGCLLPDSAPTDIQEFAELKKQRDDVTHGAEIHDSELHAERVRNLLRRYLDADLRAGR